MRFLQKEKSSQYDLFHIRMPIKYCLLLIAHTLSKLEEKNFLDIQYHSISRKMPLMFIIM